MGCVRSRNATFPYYGPLMGFGPGFVLRCASVQLSTLQRLSGVGCGRAVGVQSAVVQPRSSSHVAAETKRVKNSEIGSCTDRMDSE